MYLTPPPLHGKHEIPHHRGIYYPTWTRVPPPPRHGMVRPIVACTVHPHPPWHLRNVSTPQERARVAAKIRERVVEFERKAAEERRAARRAALAALQARERKARKAAARKR